MFADAHYWGIGEPNRYCSEPDPPLSAMLLHLSPQGQ
jgi:hypothetical protein